MKTLPAAVDVAERAAEEQQRAEGDEVAVEDPLETAQAGVEVLADGRQRHVDDGPVEERDARAEHRRRDDPTAGRGSEADHRSGDPRGGHCW